MNIHFSIRKGYKVFGAVRRTSSNNTSRLSYMGVLDEIELVSMDIAEITNIQRLIERIEPDEIYNLAAQSFVKTSYEQPIYTSDIDGIGVTRLLETIRNLGGKPRFYQASTSEMFGKVHESPQNENTPFYPRSPYGIAKLYSHWMTINYREAWNMHACSGILFNHESPLRGTEFVTRKISQGMAQIALKKIEKITYLKTMEKENLELVDARGGWTPGKLEYKPLFSWPPKPIELIKWLFNYPDGFIFPWAAIHFSIALISYIFFLPSFDKLSSLSVDWISIIFFRNLIILFVYTSLWHWYLHIKEGQGDTYRYNLRKLGKGKQWLFGTQTKENMFFSLFSAVPIQTFYESLMLWCFVNDYMLFPIKDWFSSPYSICSKIFFYH